MKQALMTHNKRLLVAKTLHDQFFSLQVCWHIRGDCEAQTQTHHSNTSCVIGLCGVELSEVQMWGKGISFSVPA